MVKYDMELIKKKCRDCGLEKDVKTEFYSKICGRSQVKVYRTIGSLCRKCHNKEVTKILLNNRPRFIYRAYKIADKKFGRQNDLTQEIIKELIAKPCVYCNGMNVSMGLDRKDNSLGHLIGNVVPCCLRCNIIKGNMPLEAWIIIAKAVKRATKAGAFGNWIGHSSSKGKYPIR